MKAKLNQKVLEPTWVCDCCNNWVTALRTSVCIPAVSPPALPPDWSDLAALAPAFEELWSAGLDCGTEGANPVTACIVLWTANKFNISVSLISSYFKFHHHNSTIYFQSECLQRHEAGRVTRDIRRLRYVDDSTEDICDNPKHGCEDDRV